MDTTADKLMLLERLAAYADAVNRRDGDDWIECWAPDGVWLIRDKRIEGRAAIKSAWETAMSGYEEVHFFAHLGRIEVSGDTASARSYTQEFLSTTAGERRTQFGEYDDRFRRVGDRWLFTERSFHIRGSW